ncbi:CcdC protein domain-containing protein [uncultured Pseudoalteromonas sp.]|uniref:CcdC protein domain-containing protein n=1 Tax=unclassified Pseudoalteromonas TaxID=194690 RepID=UPI0032B193E6
MILNHFEGLNLSLPALKISELEQLNNEIFALLSTRFLRLTIDYLIKRIGMKSVFKEYIYAKATRFLCFTWRRSYAFTWRSKSCRYGHLFAVRCC